MFEIAAPKEFIDNMLMGKRIVFAENKNAALYNSLLLPDMIFFKGHNKQDVFFKAKNYAYEGLMDRDFLSDDEVDAIRKLYSFLYVLPYHSMENLLYHPVNLEEAFKAKSDAFDAAAYTTALTEAKNAAREKLLLILQTARGENKFLKPAAKSKLDELSDGSSAGIIADMLKSDDLETFMKVFPLRDYGGSARKDLKITPDELSRTQWFKDQILKSLT